MKETLDQLAKIIQRADFYYPMCDREEWRHRNEYMSDWRRYTEIYEKSDLPEEVKNDMRDLWKIKEKYADANMRGDDEKIIEYANKYNEIFDKYYRANNN